VVVRLKSEAELTKGIKRHMTIMAIESLTFDNTISDISGCSKLKPCLPSGLASDYFLRR